MGDARRRARPREPDLPYWARDRSIRSGFIASDGIRSARDLLTLDNAIENLSRRFKPAALSSRPIFTGSGSFNNPPLSTALMPLVPSQGLNQPKTRLRIIATPAFLLHTLKFGRNKILMGAPTVIDRLNLDLVEIYT
jgi:hypothetical protein